MKKLLTVLALLILGVTTAAFAGERQLSDSEMDGINAGDWVILTQPDGSQSVVDVYAVNNTLWLLEDSQKDIKAISNANTIDSAIAVQTNIQRVTGSPSNNVGVNGANSATLANYRPSDSEEKSHSITKEKGESKFEYESKESSKNFLLGLESGSSSSESKSSSSSSSFGLIETEDVVASMAGSSKDIGKNGISGSSFAGAYISDYDLLILAASSKSKSKSESSSEFKVLDISNSETKKETGISKESKTESTSIQCASSSRSSKGANNHILLDATSQQSIRAISNLNSVASGAAIQANIASNVGVTGTITHSNTAVVSSGF